MLLPPSGDWRKGKCSKTVARHCRRFSSRVGGHMDPEKFESIEFNCQFFTISVEGRNKAEDEKENWLVFSHLGRSCWSPFGIVCSGENRRAGSGFGIDSKSAFAL